MSGITDLINLSSRVAIVTGGAMGIGFGIASRLAEAGASVVVADINESAALAAVKEFTSKGWKAAAVRADISKGAEVDAMMKFAVTTFGGVHILVNNAGIYPMVPVMQMTEADFERVLSVNLKSAFLCVQAVAKQMIAQGTGGKIINVTSVDALHPSMVGLAIYDASKHGMWGFTKNVALELAPHKIWVNAIAPGGIATPGTGMTPGSTPPPQLEEAIKHFMAKIPMHRMGEPDEIGKVALFLASDMSSYMTGSQIIVDGGVLLS